MACITLRGTDDKTQELELPENISLSLMELLKAYELPVAGTCGGMALCGSCHIQILKGAEKLHEMGGIEDEMLATLPNSTPGSRLACQIRVSNELDGLEIRILGEG